MCASKRSGRAELRTCAFVSFLDFFFIIITLHTYFLSSSWTIATRFRVATNRTSPRSTIFRGCFAGEAWLHAEPSFPQYFYTFSTPTPFAHTTHARLLLLLLLLLLLCTCVLGLGKEKNESSHWLCRFRCLLTVRYVCVPVKQEKKHTTEKQRQHEREICFRQQSARDGELHSVPKNNKTINGERYECTLHRATEKNITNKK